jgi:hypothetical protein
MEGSCCWLLQAAKQQLLPNCTMHGCEKQLGTTGVTAVHN